MAFRTCWAIAALLLACLVLTSLAQPSIRASQQNDDQSLSLSRNRGGHRKRGDSGLFSRGSRRSDRDRRRSYRQNVESCHQHIPCGFAQYGLPRRLGSDSSRSSRFKPIFKYTRSYCGCDDGYSCVLTDNRPDMDMYMFHCRAREASGHMFRFPNSRT